ncbi:filament integrity protein FraC [Dapis sp. BLCC M126]|uniref:filament integrity protein FraC n=1 Tax=Dapis sp. BLCC M126 TaxID=3400189 RepID=UPI003CEB3693
MNLTILPLRAVVSESLILLIVIAIESCFFQLRLNLIPKVSVEYATVMNLISTCVGWVFFFYSVSLLPNMWEKQIVAYILFGKIGTIYPLFILFISVSFLISLIIKLLGFNLCDSLWNKNYKNNGVGINISQALEEFRTPKFLVITLAHTCSHLAIGFILFLQRSELT